MFFNLKERLKPGSSSNQDRQLFYQQKRIQERLKREPVYYYWQNMETIGKPLAIVFKLNEEDHRCYLRFDSSPTHKRLDDDTKVIDYTRLEILKKLIHELDNIYGYYQQKDDQKMLESVSHQLKKLVELYLPFYTLGGTIVFDHHPPITNPETVEELLSVTTRL